MPRTVSIGAQDFEELIIENCFYIDKTSFIKEWWETKDKVTLITRPRRFGKTLNLSMLECFFSLKYAKRGELFDKLTVWKDEKYRELQGTYPVLFLSFAGVKENTYKGAVHRLCDFLQALYIKHYYLFKSDVLTDGEKVKLKKMADDMRVDDAPMSLHWLSDYLYRYYGKKVIILLDEYDTPMQEAYVSGYWEEIVAFTRTLFNNTFKTNPYLERAVMTGITRVSKESLFSDLNNLKVITTSSNKYASCFGFTEEEVFTAMDEFSLMNKAEVKKWYDGFTIGNLRDIYNPWSIINFLDEGKLKTLELTNYEVCKMFKNMVSDWFCEDSSDYNDFIKALLLGDVEAMNDYMNELTVSIFSSFDYCHKEGSTCGRIPYDLRTHQRATDAGNKPSVKSAPERFYHGFVLGLLVELSGRYEVTSNRESGFGRYDVMLYPLNKEDDGIILEFKVYDSIRETSLEETVQNARKQIEAKKYKQTLTARGIDDSRIRIYGFAFEGKRVLIA